MKSLWEDQAGRLWVGLSDRLFIWDGKMLKDLKPQITGPFMAYAIQEDGTGAVWVGGEQGLLKFQGDQLIARYTANEGVPNDDVKVIYETKHGPRKGELWFGTYGGLAQFKDGKFINFTTAQGLVGNRVRSIYEDAEGTLWIGTYDDGLSRFRDGKFFYYRTEHGLYNNGVFHILEDKHGYFWISCNRGIYRVSRQELNDFADGRIPKVTSIAFGKQDGMLNSECNGGRQPAGLTADDGKFWFPTMGGVAVFDPEALRLNPQPPPVLIESLTLEHRQIDFQNGVTIRAGQRDLEIHYTGLSFIKSEQVKFKYRLEGLDADWMDAGTRRVAYFPYLPPGTYTFHVNAANSDGVWNTTGASVRISVLTPYWRTWWFALLSVSGIVGILLGTLILRHRRRVETLERQRADQIQFSRQLIESQERERKRIAAELHDSLGQRLLVIKNWTALSLMLTPEDAPARGQMNEIAENASQAIEETRQIVFHLRPFQLDKIGLTRTLKFMVEQIATSSGIDLMARIADLDGAFSPDDEISFYRIVQECLNNVVKHSGASQAGVLIERDTSIRLQVSDNGRGFMLDRLDQKQRGFGLSGIAERARLLGGEYKIESAPGRGTTISVTIGDVANKKRTL